MKVKECRFGPMMYLENDKFIGGAIEAYAEHHVLELELLLEVVSEGDVVIDVGSNIGTIAVPLAQKIGDTGYLFAYEPQDMLYYVLCGNIALNRLRNVKPFNNAVGAESGKVMYVPDFTYEEDGWNYGGVSLDKHAGIPVKTLMLDSLMKLDIVRKLKLIKIDVEGMEIDVLRGAQELISQARPYLAIEAMENQEELYRFLVEREYELYVWEPPYFNPNNFAGNEENILGRRVVMTNIFCWPKEKQLQFDSPYFVKDLNDSDNPRHQIWYKLQNLD